MDSVTTSRPKNLRLAFLGSFGQTLRLANLELFHGRADCTWARTSSFPRASGRRLLPRVRKCQRLTF